MPENEAGTEPGEPPVTAQHPVTDQPPATDQHPVTDQPPATDQHPVTEPDHYVDAPEDLEFTEIDRDEPVARGGVLRTAGRVSVRVIVGLVVLAVVAIVVIAASTVPLPANPHRAAASEVVTPVPTAHQLVCPGGLLRLASASGKGATKASALGAASTTSAASSSGSTSTRIDRRAFGASDAKDGGSGAAPQLLSTPTSTSGRAQTFVSGAQSQTVTTDEFGGLASSACTAATGQAWLDGGSTSVGRTTLLLLANPSDVPASVSIRIYGENGPVTAPGTDGIIVAPRGQRVLSLAGFAPGLASPVVHVMSRGGRVVATLEQSTTRGLQPGGIDFVSGTGALQRTTVIPGVVVSGTSTVQGLLGQSGYDDLQTTLRIYEPGDKAIEANVSVISESGQPTGKAVKADLNPGKVTEFPLDNVPDGSYTVRVTAAVPIDASIRVSTAGSTAGSTAAAPTSSAAGGAPTDFAWLAGAPLLTSSALVTIATGMTPAIHFYNPTRSAENVTLTAVGGGADLSTSVPAGAAVTMTPVAGTTYRLGGYTGLYASVSGVADGGVTGYVVNPSEQSSGPLRVYG